MARPANAKATIQLFGPLVIAIGERTIGPRDLGGMRPKQVLEIVLVARGHRVPTDRLADLLWGQELPENAVGSLQTVRAFGDRVEPISYLFAPEVGRRGRTTSTPTPSSSSSRRSAPLTRPSEIAVNGETIADGLGAATRRRSDSPI